MLCITLLVSTFRACSVTGDQVFHYCRDGQVFHFCRDHQVFHSCRDDGLRLSDCRSTPDTCFGDVLHLVRLLANLRTRALVMILTVLDFLCFPLVHLSHARAVVMVLTKSGFSATFSIILNRR